MYKPMFKNQKYLLVSTYIVIGGSNSVVLLTSNLPSPMKYELIIFLLIFNQKRFYTYHLLCYRL